MKLHWKILIGLALGAGVQDGARAGRPRQEE
jgi:hypothetical protein